MGRGVRVWCVAAWVILAGVSWGAVGEAQENPFPSTRGLTRGLTLPWESVVDREDALSLELNPAGLARVQGWEVMAAAAHRREASHDGYGAFLALSPLDGLGLGYGLQRVASGPGGYAYNKHTLGAAAGGPFALGFNYNLYGSDAYADLDALTSWDLGVQLRLASWLGLAANLRDLTSPFLNDAALIAPSLDAGAALRFFDGRLVVEANATITRGSEQIEPRLLALVEPLDGLRLFGQLNTDTGEHGGELRFVGARAGVELNFAHLGVSGAGLFGGGDAGFTATARASQLAWRDLLGEPQRFVTLTLAGDPPERPSVDLLGRPDGASHLQLMQQLEAMRRDESVDGVVLDLRGVEMGYGQLWEVRQGLLRLKERGVKLVAYMRETGFRDYYLASAADHILAGPSATFNARGVLALQSFYRGAFDKLGVEPDFVKIAEYKTAPESFTREAPTEENQEALNTYLDAIYDLQLREIAAARKLEPQALRELIDRAPLTPEAARSAQLVDEVVYVDALEERVREKFGASVRFAPSYGRDARSYRWGRRPIIAVIYVDGAIVTGESGVNPLLGGVLSGSRTVEAAAQWAMDNPDVVGVVLRVDSPGGSAVGSDLMYRALERLREKKPLVVSMGDVAASGGYYVAAAGKRVFCAPTTLTGSIGVYSGKFSLAGLFDKLGYHRVPYARGAHANIYGVERAWTDEERANVQAQIAFLYDLFLEQVGKGRGLSRDAIDAVARGRIWSGQEAVKLKLCDESGGLHDAIAFARQEAGLSEDQEADLAQIPRAAFTPPGLPAIGVDVQGAFSWLSDAPVPPITERDGDREAWRQLQPLRDLAGPLLPALEVAVLFGDGEAMARLPAVVEWR